MPLGEMAKVMVEDPHRPVGEPPGLPRADDEDAHARNHTGVSVVVCSRNRAPLLARALDALRVVLRPQDELVVVDSASTDADVVAVAARHDADVVRLDRAGLGRAREAGRSRATRPVVAFTDDDCVPDAGWTAALERAFADERTGFVFGRVRATGAGEPLSVVDESQPRTIGPSALAHPEEFGHGANFACRADALAAIGGFDEELGAGSALRSGEDVDVVRRLLHAGWVGRYEPEAVVSHEQWRGRLPALRVMFGYGVGAGALAVKERSVSGDRSLLRQELVGRGLAQAWRDLRAGYEFGVVAGLCRTAGVVAGARRARRLSLTDGRFRR